MLPIEKIARCSRDEELRPIIGWMYDARNLDTNLTAVRVGSGIGLFQSEQPNSSTLRYSPLTEVRDPCASPGNFRPKRRRRKLSGGRTTGERKTHWELVAIYRERPCPIPLEEVTAFFFRSYQSRLSRNSRIVFLP